MSDDDSRIEEGSGNVFADIGFSPAEAKEMMAKSELILAMKDIIAQRKLTQKEAARLCGCDQSSLSKALHGRLSSVTVDRLENWLVTLGVTV